MSIKELPFAHSLQKKIGSSLVWLPLSANQITLSSVLFALVGLYFSSQLQPLPSLLLFLLAGALDAIDGAVARARHQVTAKGAYIDGIVDRLVEFLLILSLLLYPLPAFLLPAELSLILVLFFGTTMTAFTIAYADHRKAADQKKLAGVPGILPRAERLLLLFAALALVPFYPAASSFLLFAVAALALVTFGQRFAHFAN